MHAAKHPDQPWPLTLVLQPKCHLSTLALVTAVFLVKQRERLTAAVPLMMCCAVLKAPVWLEKCLLVLMQAGMVLVSCLGIVHTSPLVTP